MELILELIFGTDFGTCFNQFLMRHDHSVPLKTSVCSLFLFVFRFWKWFGTQLELIFELVLNQFLMRYDHSVPLVFIVFRWFVDLGTGLELILELVFIQFLMRHDHSVPLKNHCGTHVELSLELVLISS